MDALVVYNVAQALSLEERVKLCDMLKSELFPKSIKKKLKTKISEFTDEDALMYLLKLLKINEP